MAADPLIWGLYLSNMMSKMFEDVKTDKQLPVHEATVLEVITVTSDLQLPASEAFSLIEGNLEEKYSDFKEQFLTVTVDSAENVEEILI